MSCIIQSHFIKTDKIIKPCNCLVCQIRSKRRWKRYARVLLPMTILNWIYSMRDFECGWGPTCSKNPIGFRINYWARVVSCGWPAPIGKKPLYWQEPYPLCTIGVPPIQTLRPSSSISIDPTSALNLFTCLRAITWSIIREFLPRSVSVKRIRLHRSNRFGSWS